MKDTFDGLDSDERLCELEDISIENLKTKRQREQRLHKINKKTR